MEKELNEWDLTEDEKRELEDLQLQGSALTLMTDAQHKVAIKIAEAERRWWKKVLTRLELDTAWRPGVSVDVKAGKLLRSK